MHSPLAFGSTVAESVQTAVLAVVAGAYLLVSCLPAVRPSTGDRADVMIVGNGPEANSRLLSRK